MTHRVLIVDDLEINRDILEGILEDDYDLLFAENGRQAVDIAIANQDAFKNIPVDFQIIYYQYSMGHKGLLKMILQSGRTIID